MSTTMPTVLALDQGTTSSRAMLFDRAGRCVASAQQEFRQFFPQPGWVEHDPGEIWASQLAVAARAIQGSGHISSGIAALGITNQRETTVLWNRRNGQAVAPAIVWQDRRTAGHCQRLRDAGHAPDIQQKTGLVLDAYFSATKLAWLLDHTPGARAAAESGQLAFGTIDSWLIWNLTGGEHVTDVSNASRTLLFNLHTLDWDDALLQLFNIPRALLPRVVSSSGLIGETHCEGLPKGIPISGIAGDQQAALFGQACHTPGMAKNTYGTGCFMLMNTGTTPVPSTHRLLTTVAWRVGGETQYALEGSVFIGGAVVQWLRDGLGFFKSAAEIEALAASVPDTGGVYLVPAFAGLGAPHWDPDARGTIVGMTRGTTRAHIARAALESIAFQSADLLDAMTADANIRLTEMRVDGGAAVNNMLMQFQCDLLGVPVVRPAVTETTALGAAFLAGLGTGFWKDRAEIGALWQEERRFSPQSDASYSGRKQQWTRAVECARHWSSQSLE
jgi:glycerol kinase